MNRERAREILILRIIDDELDLRHTTAEQVLRYLLRHGHVGFNDRTNQELLELVYGRNLHVQDDELNEACETLEEPVP